MKEIGEDYVKTGFKMPGDGWHKFTFKEGIDYRKNEAGDAPHTNERGFKTLIFPCVIEDDTDQDNGSNNNQFVGMEKGGSWLANILACVGLWEAVKKRFPGADVSVFDAPVLEGIKTKLPELTCMMKTEQEKDKNGVLRVRTREMASHAKYKEIEAEEKKKAVAGKKSDKKTTAASTETGSPEATGKGW